jgi:non-specific serine/threonine protein kinase
MPVELPSGVSLTYAHQYRRCGKPTCLLCAAGGRGHGPYWYAYWREGGRTRSRYLGKLPPAGVASPATPSAGMAAPETLPPADARSTASVARPATPNLRARTLGGFALWRGEERLPTERWERQQVGILLKWLLSASGHRLTRDQVVERFWPEGTPEQWMANVRVLVHRLRHALGEMEGEAGSLRYDGEVLAFAPDGAAEMGWLDADVFARATRAALAGQDAGACRAALTHYTGDYLPGDAYEEWAIERREELRGRRVMVLLHLATLCGAGGEPEEAETSLRTVLVEDPCHEAAAQSLMRLHAAAGRPGQALRVYRRLAAALREELALEPEEETQALACALALRQPDTPAPAVPDTVPNNLPAPLTSFIGRRRELADLRALLRPAHGTAACRLLTLTGPGGSGKTRLALQLADDLLDAPGAYPDGVWLVELASLADPALAPKAVAQALGVQEEGTRPLAETLAAYLKTRRLLLLLDNCEHLLDACAELAARLLSHCPSLRILATSRAALGVPGERPWPVPALSVPDPGGAVQVGRLLESEAVRLFLERARVQRPDLTLTDGNAAAVARICRQLDGIPLALELAAARMSVLGLEQIAEKLSESLRLLTGGPRATHRRQRTLRATLDWSYHLLSTQEQCLLRRLSVFAGGCTLEAAEAVCAVAGVVAPANQPGPAAAANPLAGSRDEELDQAQVLDLLSGLARHSLVQVDDDQRAARYCLLETVRQYAAEHLVASGEVREVRARHLWWCVVLAEKAEPLLRGPAQGQWLDRLEREHDNLRAALAWSMRQRGEPAAAVELAGALWRFWWAHGHLAEGRAWLALARGCPAPAHRRARVLKGEGNLAIEQLDLPQARALHEESLALYREFGDRQGIANALHNLGNLARGQHDFPLAARRYEESLALKRELGDRWGIASALGGLGNLAHDQGDYPRARALHEESLSLYRELGDRRGIAMSLQGLGNVSSVQGSFHQARALYEESLSLYRELGNKCLIALTLSNLAGLATAPGSGAEVLGRAARLLGAVAALRETIGAPEPLSERAYIEHASAAIRCALGEIAWAAAWAEGQALTLEQTVSLALGAPSAP